jgi:hypothetical protein
LKRDLIYIGQHLSDPAFVFAGGGSEKVGNADAQVVTISGPGTSVKWDVDAKSGRVLRESFQAMRPSGPVQAEAYLDDWKTADGLTLPYLRKNKENGQDSSTSQFTSIQINPTVDAKLFDKPSSEAKAQQ